MSTRRLPVYIMADVSGSMQGTPIESVKSGIRQLHRDLMGDPQAIESAYLSVLTFANSAQQLVPLTEVAAFNPPDLSASGNTHFGDGLRLLLEVFDRELVRTTAEVKGDWRPLVFILSDGAPTDTEWPIYAQQLRERRPANIIAVACGDQADTQVLKQVTESVIQMQDMSPDAFKAFFRFVSASVKQTSAKVGALSDGAGITLPPPPPGITIVP
ncbi:VWA domain-containing protein [Gemmatimonas sp.]|uniref:vWA domain-containing protein n=1 Tax=Gemmatimonas sp. TaxID=1962908 RepID=UPI0035680A4C